MTGKNMRRNDRRAPQRLLAVLLWVLGAFGISGAVAEEDPKYREKREAMLRVVLADMAATAQETGRETLSLNVLEAMRRVPRHLFVPLHLVNDAYENRPLPIGFGQTISQPFIVALMTELLDLPKDARVLEIGTGSGYQAAVLAQVAKEVYSVEILPELAQGAETRLKNLGYVNVHVKTGDGYFGWKEHAPFDGIMVTAAAPHIPPPLMQQLKPGGKLVLPVGPPFLTQYLTVVHKAQDGTATTKQVLPVAFVPLVRSSPKP
ncbi:MAG: protein-L-isoaspartate(D-aspartate) O-methyltransferase [Desulfosoma sp.]